MMIPPTNYPTLQIGSTGPAVVHLQESLVVQGFDPGMIDGIFGPKTQAAVIAFQSCCCLVPDGIVGPITWAALEAACPPPLDHLSGAQMSSCMPYVSQAGCAPSAPARPARTQSCPTLREGSRGASVRELQTLLSNHGFNPGPIDGIFGPRTRAAVVSFQTSKGLSPDGIVGPRTWAALGVNCTSSPSTKCPTLRRGSRGSSVRTLQTRLNNQGFNPGPIDGIFGSRTQAAVIAFQNSRCLSPDGIVGRKTWAALGGCC
ncbi:Peptidoglycan-binding domain 1 protein [Syntrophobotulus glycolicus DSM 8271]|uniref:Peptidoglycan-binding domain 1 protein n=1 Tax=Syntrophobotulus glycolicus (strain DSM 8271 / FlGlyR) TaxID=645991 RepID=F0T1R2_SYNGF|nr:Peptidoglycan-binding domain 1 protein [Syntrophobotulus glycolicus DSM 8271]